jgi:hypothetical protein
LKKNLVLAMILVLSIMVVFTAVLVPFYWDVTPDVGWNASAGQNYAAPLSGQAFCWDCFIPQPNVGWNG